MSDPKTRQLAVKGRVIPEYTGVTTPTINISWQYTELDLHLKARISINNSIVNVTCEMNKLDNQDHLNKALIEFDRLAGILVNAQSFGTGLGLELRFDTFSIDGGPDRPHWVADVKLAALATMTRTKEDQLYIFELAHNNLTFSMVLRHLNEALLAPRRVVVRTTQAIDGLRSLLVPPGGKDKDGWREMQNNLNLSENYLKTITEASKGLRHGNYTELPGANRTDIAYRAWEVMNRFISYKKRRLSAAFEGALPGPVSLPDDPKDRPSVDCRSWVDHQVLHLRLHVQEQDRINLRCWMNIEPEDGWRDHVRRAIRKAKRSLGRPASKSQLAASGPKYAFEITSGVRCPQPLS